MHMGVQHKLSARAVDTARHPGGTKHAHRLGDGGGLYLQVTAAGTKSWLFRYVAHGRPTLMGLGSFDKVTNNLAQAREKAAAQRSILAGGADPLSLKAAKRRKAGLAAATAESRTFKAAALAFIEQQAPSWKNAKHAWQVKQTLEAHAFPVLGTMPVADIGTAEVLRVLNPIWATIPETAQRLRGRIEAVLDFAKAGGLRSGDNPAAWRGHLVRLLPSPRKAGGRGHQPALPWGEVAAFMAALAEREGAAARALGFLVLTAARTTEVIGTRWGEVDLDAGMWTVPAERMKAGREHRVPLSTPALALLRDQLPLADGPASVVFQSGSKGSGAGALSNMALLALLRRMNPADEAGAYTGGGTLGPAPR